MVLSAQPRLGSRDVTFTHVTDWIENKLVAEMHVSEIGDVRTFRGHPPDDGTPSGWKDIVMNVSFSY